MTGTTRRRLTPEQRREELLSTATAMAARDGLDALNLETVAAEAGCSRGLAYTYFPNRDALVSALIEAELARFTADVLEVIPLDAGVEDWMSAWAELAFDAATERGVLVVAMFRDQLDKSGDALPPGTLIRAASKRLQRDLELPPQRASALAGVLLWGLMGAVVSMLRNGVRRSEAQSVYLAAARASVAAVAG